MENGYIKVKTHEDMEWFMRSQIDPIEKSDDFKSHWNWK